ncbi:hypothetical protein [Cupriavidus sp. BIS7]|uniref:hypothetical protein n=1 Tax=Cupriavidus sp. BIS7 TaxID=1217718 RepID=UPI000379CD85|nr:hypothetical protein [Cupriavidus sp. BIS7]
MRSNLITAAAAIVFAMTLSPHADAQPATTGPIVVGGSARVEGPATITGTLRVDGNVFANGPLTADWFASPGGYGRPPEAGLLKVFHGPLTVHGTMVVRGDLYVDGPLTVNGALEAAGHISASGPMVEREGGR